MPNLFEIFESLIEKKEAQYLGSCVDIDNNPESAICNIIPDATELSSVVDDENDGKKFAISKEKYYSLGGRDKIGSKTIVKNDSIFGLNKKERIFWAYTNSGKNGWIHYFFDL